METEFSKGKWICNKSIAPLTGIEGEIEISTTDKTVVEWIALCHDSANAQLISAAPDLLNSLNDILIYCRSNSTSQLEPLIRNAEIAIKKATVSESF